MSAFVVSTKHIDALVTYALTADVRHTFSYYYQDKSHVVNSSNASEVGQILVNMNYASVNYRYSEMEMPPEYEFRYLNGKTPVEILKACACYDYQSCEIPGYYQGEAHEIIDTIRHWAISHLPGYDEATWEVRP